MARLSQYFDRRFEPIQGFWNFNGSMTDLSGNGFDWSIDVGEERYAQVLPGIKGFFFDGSTRLIQSAAHSELQFTGDMTCLMLASFPRQLEAVPALSPSVITCGNHQTSGEAENILYDFNVAAEGSTIFFHEQGDSSGVTYTTPNSITTGTPTVVGWKRENNIYSLWSNSRLLGQSGVLAAPTGGANSILRMGSAGTGAPDDPFLENSIVSSLMLIGAAISDERMAMLSNITLAPVFGAL